MKNEAILRKIIQAILVFCLIFTVMEFYQHDYVPFLIKEFVTVALVVVNCVYSYRIGLKDGTEDYREISEMIRKDYNKRLNKAVDMIIEERKKNRVEE